MLRWLHQSVCNTINVPWVRTDDGTEKVKVLPGNGKYFANEVGMPAPILARVPWRRRVSNVKCGYAGAQLKMTRVLLRALSRKTELMGELSKT